MLELGSEYNNDFIDSDAENTSDEFIFDSNTFNVIHEQLMNDLISDGWDKKEADECAQDHINYLAKAARYYLIELEDELAKGSDSQLRVLENGEITFKSFYQWFDVIKLKYGEVKSVITFQDELNDSSNMREIRNLLRTRGGDQASLYVTFAHLLDKYAEMNKTKYMNKGSINVTALATELERSADAYTKENGNKLIGQSAESIKNRIENALKIHEIFLKS